MEKVILFGNGKFASMNHFYLQSDSPYEVVAFTVDRAYLNDDHSLDLPIIPFEEIEASFPPSGYKMAIPLGLQNVNQLRAQKYQQARQKGYQLITYISSRAITHPGLEIGENCFVFENVVLKPYCHIGSDVIIEAGSVVGHHVTIGDHCFLGPNSVILGNARVESYCVIGANATVRDGITIGRGSIVGAGALVTHNAREKSIHLGRPAEILPQDSDELGGLLTQPGR